MEQQNNLGADDSAKVDQINALLGGKPAPEPVDKKKADDASAEPVDQVETPAVIDPELAFDTDQPASADKAASDEPEGDQSAQDEHKPVTLKDVAESLELESKDLYEVEIPTGLGDETVTLGQLKDSHKELIKLNAERVKYDDNRRTSENELLVSRRQVAQLIHLGQSQGLLNDDIIQQIDNIHSQNLQRERSALMSVIPEWEDKATRDLDFKEIVAELAEYGIQQNEIEQSLDHRLVKFVHDTVKRLRAVRAAKAAGKVPKNIRPGGRKGSATTPLQQKINAAKGGTSKDKAVAIDAILSGLN